MGLAPRGKNILIRQDDSLFADTRQEAPAPQARPAAPAAKLRSGCVQKNWLIPQELARRIKLAAVHTGTTESQIVREALGAYLDALSRKMPLES
ncbi:MAG: hypothetical protein PUB01_02670 [Desulfovibrionaceae bacterium]|nr:hypothetical protein [Desulfovibrionaceae bacterium]